MRAHGWRAPKQPSNLPTSTAGAAASRQQPQMHAPALVEAEGPVRLQRGAAHHGGELAHDIQGARAHENVLRVP